MNTKFKWIATGIGIAGVIATLAYFLHKTYSRDKDSFGQPNTCLSKYDIGSTLGGYPFNQNVNEPFNDSYTTTSMF